MSVRVLFVVIGSIFICTVMTGCSFVVVQNTHETVPVRVVVRMPESGRIIAGSRAVAPGHIEQFFSTYGGAFEVRVVPEDSYKAVVTDVRDRISRTVFGDATPSGEQVRTLHYMLNRLDSALQQISQGESVCSGRVPDFTTASVRVQWNQVREVWEVECH